MDKFLLTDGTNGVREVHSKADLLALISSENQPGQGYGCFTVMSGSAPLHLSANNLREPYPAPIPILIHQQHRTLYLCKRGWTMLGYSLAAVAAALLIFNFTRAGWEAQGSISNSTVRPANVPQLDTDSLALVIEWQRGKALDKGTRTNLRNSE